MTATSRIARISAVLRTVPDLAAAEGFYRDAMGFETVEPACDLGPDEAALLGVHGGRCSLLTMRLGQQQIGFLRFDPGGRPYPSDSTASDLWFQHCAVVVADMDAAYQIISRQAIRPLSRGGPQQLPANTGGVVAYKFRDPFGHALELLWLPDRVGNPVWHGNAGGLFRGIDHTAIAVADGADSSRFYANVLGFKVGDRSLNAGAEQDRLDDIEGVTVDVIALAPREQPPHLELLGYRAGARRRSRGENASDASVSRTLGVVDDLKPMMAALGGRALPLGRRGTWRGRDAARICDPDGHTWICMEA